MGIYEGFAYIYAHGSYPQYSLRISGIFPSILEYLGAKPKTVLDLACGEGTFAVNMAMKGFKVTGVDISPYMLELAKQLAKKKHVDVDFLLQDIRSLALERKFDLVTCWYDSLNYLLKKRDLETTFAGVCRILGEKGFFIFDINTIYGFVTRRQKHLCIVEQNSSEILEINRLAYDFEENIASTRITGFIRGEREWARIDEVHKQRGYSLGEIKECLRNAKLQELACWGNLQRMSDPQKDSERVWFATQKMHGNTQNNSELFGKHIRLGIYRELDVLIVGKYKKISISMLKLMLSYKKLKEIFSGRNSEVSMRWNTLKYVLILN